eukprot:TRINITY_DN679_c0_g1_i1.p1 TRINITY_DN679_c0_g1~~TRINITY_DN679_c0_g1_i1.p1  ORF type:complete len:260 (-),score=45.12 TRINITY_DN679_c0_g1_i1:150-929(-)
MCFNQPISFIFFAIGTAMAIMLAFKMPQKPRVAISVFYFSFMEFIQFMQYFWVDKCTDTGNQFWTIIGFLHITFQPLFCNLLTSGFDKTEMEKYKSKIMISICLWCAAFLWLAFFLGPMFFPQSPEVQKCTAVSQDPLRSDTLCTKTGEVHIAWHIPMTPASYWVPNLFLHFFCMFIPYFVEPFSKPQLAAVGIVSLIIGPGLAVYLTKSKFEQASVWCYLSIFQIVLIMGRFIMPKKKKNTEKKDTVVEPTEVKDKTA